MDKYLRQYAEQDTAAVADFAVNEPWQQVVVIPVCSESTRILRPLPAGSGRSLMILIVNEAETAPRQVSVANEAFAAELKSRFRMHGQATVAGLTLYHDPASPRDVLLVDRFRAGRKVPLKGGVGHARKIGADLAAYLIQQRRVRSPWIHCTDADVRLPRHYFSCAAALSDGAAQDTAALVYPFRHRSTANQPGEEILNIQQHKIMRATRLYEYSLRYYVAGLGFARSPYAFHTIGSTLAVNAAHYAQVRGFPRRRAGEDFYLLNKLAKVGSVMQLDAETHCEPIVIAARLSDRVPFGTGAAVGRIMEMKDPAWEFVLYHPAVFGLLRSWLGSLSAFWQSRSCNVCAILSQGPATDQARRFSIHPPADLQALIGGLEESGAAEALHHAFRQSGDAGQFKRQMHTWFDAFRTLKLIHYLRDHHLPSICFKALATQPNIDHLLRHEATLPSLHQTLRKDLKRSRRQEVRFSGKGLYP